MPNIGPEIIPSKNKFLINEGYPSPKAAGFADIPKMADIAPFVAAVPGSLFSPGV